jgi:hypothetical protein
MELPEGARGFSPRKEREILDLLGSLSASPAL